MISIRPFLLRMSVFFITFTSHSILGMAQSLAAKIDSLMRIYERQYSFSGAVLVSTQGNVILEKGYGYKNRDLKTLNDSNTIFQIGSITKQFTSAIILQLLEGRQLFLEDQLSKFIPDYPNGNHITIENLLTHTSGVYNYTNDQAFMKNGSTHPIARESLLALFKNKELEFTPGEKFAYSNSGYILLGSIIEKLTGKTWFEAVRERIFQPLHMDHSGFNFSSLSDSNKASGYTRVDSSTPAPVVDSSVSFAAGSIFTSLGDLYKWDRALYGNKILTQASLQKAFTSYKQKYGYGYGWMVDSSGGKKKEAHGGGITGFMSFILRVPVDQTCIIVMDNCPVKITTDKITFAIYGVMNGRSPNLMAQKTKDYSTEVCMMLLILLILIGLVVYIKSLRTPRQAK